MRFVLGENMNSKRTSISRGEMRLVSLFAYSFVSKCQLVTQRDSETPPMCATHP